MAGILQELEEENLKSGLFTESDTGVSYPTGFPILDQQLGFKQTIHMKDGTDYTQYRLGLTGGTINMLVGPSSSGKTAAAIQMAHNIVEPYGLDGGAILLDAEASTEPQRIMDLTGCDEETYTNTWRILDNPQNMTFDKTLDIVRQIAEKKKSDPKRFKYNTGFKNIHGEDIIYYKPTVIVVDSLLRIVSDTKDLEEIPGLTSGGRDAIFRGKWYRNLLGYTREFNIIILVVNHLGNAIELQPGKGGAKQLTFIPTGKNIPGGEKPVYYSSSIIIFQPVNSKDLIKTEELNGYSGLPVKVAVGKSRSGPGGTTATLEFVQTSGFDITLSLLGFAREKELIQGRNPNCYFAHDPDVKFDTRIFLEELANKPELMMTLYRACKPELLKLVRETASSSDNAIMGANAKKQSRQAMRELFMNGE